MPTSNFLRLRADVPWRVEIDQLQGVEEIAGCLHARFSRLRWVETTGHCVADAPLNATGGRGRGERRLRYRARSEPAGADSEVVWGMLASGRFAPDTAYGILL